MVTTQFTVHSMTWHDNEADYLAEIAAPENREATRDRFGVPPEAVLELLTLQDSGALTRWFARHFPGAEPLENKVNSAETFDR